MKLLSRAASFWLLAVLLGFFLFAASAPSPLYAIYAAEWDFSPLTLTEIYAVYALGALAALLTTGRLSDHVGRRRVLLPALVIQIAGMAVFIVAQGVGALFVARILQGIGTGVATGVITAWLLDLQPLQNPRLGGLIAGIALMAGLGAGALVSGLLAEYGPDPLHLVFWLLTGVYAIGLIVTFFIPDHAARTPGALRSMMPVIGVPPAARAMFAATAPSLIATWAVGGLYLSLGPSLAISLLETGSRIAGGLVIAALLIVGAGASAMVRAMTPRVIVIGGSLLLVIGVGITLFAVAIGSAVALYAGSVITGFGLGPAFSGVLRTLVPLAPPDKRGALVASIYIVVYLSFSAPTVLAGVAVTRYGLRTTTFAYGLVVIALAAVTTVAISRFRFASGR